MFKFLFYHENVVAVCVQLTERLKIVIYNRKMAIFFKMYIAISILKGASQVRLWCIQLLDSYSFVMLCFRNIGTSYIKSREANIV